MCHPDLSICRCLLSGCMRLSVGGGAVCGLSSRPPSNIELEQRSVSKPGCRQQATDELVDKPVHVILGREIALERKLLLLKDPIVDSPGSCSSTAGGPAKSLQLLKKTRFSLTSIGPGNDWNEGGGVSAPQPEIENEKRKESTEGSCGQIVSKTFRPPKLSDKGALEVWRFILPAFQPYYISE